MDNAVCNNHNNKVAEGFPPEPRRKGRGGKGRVTIVDKAKISVVQVKSNNGTDTPGKPPLSRCPHCDTCITHQIPREMVESLSATMLQLNTDLGVRMSQINDRLQRVESLLLEGFRSDSDSDGEVSCGN